MARPRPNGLARVDVRDFIQANYTPYGGDAAFPAGPTQRALAVWGTGQRALPEGAAQGILTFLCTSCAPPPSTPGESCPPNPWSSWCSTPARTP